MFKRGLFFLLLLTVQCAAWAGKNVIFTTPEEYQLFRISPNGQWACGMYVDYSNNTYAFRWNLVSGNIELLSTNEQSEAWSVSDNGVVAGACTAKLDGQASRSLPALYYDDEWHILELPSSSVAQGIAYDITPDGQYVVASLSYGGSGPYEAYIWKDGKIHRQLSDMGGGCPMPYCISPDGQTAGGWKTNYNRQACLWNADGTVTVLSDKESPWSCARRFSPDGKKVLMWGGWDEEGLLALYDLETAEKTWVAPLDDEGSFEFFDIDNNTTLVGENGGRGFVWQEGKGGQYLDAYLEERGVDLKALDPYVLEGTDYYQIFRGQSLSADGQVVGLIYYANASDGMAAMRSAVIKLDFDARDIAPAAPKASQLEGTYTARITWEVPAGVEGVTGFNVYRDGQCIATAPADAQSYHDKDLAVGTYTYEVSIVYADGESRHSTPATVAIAELKLQAPQALAARQKGFNNAWLSWAQPKSNLVTKTYADINNADIQGFGANAENFPFEVAIRFAADEVEAYEGYRLAKVNFYPLSANKDWKINVYTYEADGTTLRLLASQPVTQPLEYGKVNTVVLDNPVELPKGELVVAVGVTLEEPNLNVLGMDYGRAKARFSDLLRAGGEADFYSMEEMSMANGYMSSVSWLIDAILSKDGDAEDVDLVKTYNVYVDGNLCQTAEEFETVIPALSEGTHRLGVSVVYADGRESEPAVMEASIVNNVAALSAVRNIRVGMADDRQHLTATWDRPVDVDPTYISYAGETPYEQSVNVPDGYNMIQFAHEYTASVLKPYKGYSISSCRFFPLADATFTVLVYENGKLVAEQGVDAVTVGQWNTVSLESPVVVKGGAAYRIVLDCYDVQPGSEVLAVDCNLCYAGMGDLYSLDGETFQAISSTTGISHNVMLGFTMEDTEGLELPVVGYDVRIDGAAANATPLTEPCVEYAFSEPQTDGSAQHTIAVDVYYSAVAESVKGGVEYFTVDAATGISQQWVADLAVQQSDAMLTVAGEGVEQVSLIAADGRVVAQSDTDTVPIGQLSPGIYVVKAEAAGKTLVRKIRIRK